MNREPVREINNVPLRSLRHISTIMSLLLIISIACSLLVRLRAIEHRSPRLEIYSTDLLHNERRSPNYTFIQNGNMTLTCKALIGDRGLTMSFMAPARATIQNGSNSITMHIENLNDADSGAYVCRATGHGISLYEKVSVKIVKEPECCHPKFSCLGTGCIYRRYLCDGFADCPNGADESTIYANCSVDPCKNKIRCGERCVPPHWCCLAEQEGCNVTLIQPCCINPGSDYFVDGDVSELRKRDDGFLETTIYVVLGCATAFMLLLIILVIAICRFHMKRTPVPRHGRTGVNIRRIGGMRPGARPPTAPMAELDVYLNQVLLDLSRNSGLLVTYNRNTGVQIMGRPVDPPPYCEVVSLPPRGGPPPPYVPNESMTSLTGPDCDEGGNSVDEALLGDSNEMSRRVCVNDNRPVCDSEAYLLPSSACSRSHQSYSTAASHDSIPSGSDQTMADLVFQPALDDKYKATAASAQTTPIPVVPGEPNYKQICANSLSVDHKDLVRK